MGRNWGGDSTDEDGGKPKEEAHLVGWIESWKEANFLCVDVGMVLIYGDEGWY